VIFDIHQSNRSGFERGICLGPSPRFFLTRHLRGCRLSSVVSNVVFVFLHRIVR
jgi:hypothetical protein